MEAVYSLVHTPRNLRLGLLSTMPMTALAARTIATMPALLDGFSLGQASMIICRSISIGMFRATTAPHSAALVSAIAVFRAALDTHPLADSTAAKT